MILHERLHLVLDAPVPLGDVDVQRVVAAGLAVGPFAPLLEGGEEADAGLRQHVVNWKKQKRKRGYSHRHPCGQHLAEKRVPNVSTDRLLGFKSFFGVSYVIYGGSGAQNVFKNKNMLCNV